LISGRFRATVGLIHPRSYAKEGRVMKLQIKKVIAETHIKRIKKQLEDLDALDNQSRLQPMEKTNDTHLIVTHEDQRRKLRQQLEKYEKQLKEASE
jgi:hypothetical protein